MNITSEYIERKELLKKSKGVGRWQFLYTVNNISNRECTKGLC